VTGSAEELIALAGNPNTGKSTVFNQLTGLRQHTGNWPGKTVINARGSYTYQDKKYILVDLPGTYSLFANSEEEKVACDFLYFGQPAVTVVVLDATCLERNLNLALQILEITANVVICVNLMDEAKRKKIKVDLSKLANLLGVPVVGTNARNGEGLAKLKEVIRQAVSDNNRDEQEITQTREISSQRGEYSGLIRYDELIEERIKELELVVQKHLNGTGQLKARWVALRLLEGDESFLRTLRELGEIRHDDVIDKELLPSAAEARRILSGKGLGVNELKDSIVSAIIKKAEMIAAQVVVLEQKDYQQFDRRVDNIVTSKRWGIPIMLLLLGGVFWLTILGANYPSELLAIVFFGLEERLSALFLAAGAPAWLHGIVVLGMFRTLAWVVSVMLPPMAIFFPLFTLLEDLGYLPRVAFNLDNFFKRACAHGKQALTMCMGFGCNAAGVVACRIIDSPRERLIATITNNFVPCNGRFPTLIALTTVFLVTGQGPLQAILAALSILLLIVLAVFITLGVSRLLSKTILQGLPSAFTLELPSYRKPQIGRIIVRSLFDRTLFVLGRAVLIAAPAGALIWLLANTTVGGASALNHCAAFLDPLGRLLGMDGYILLAFFLGLPANEIVIPILIMSYSGAGSIMELNSMTALHDLFGQHGWTWVTALCTMLFMLNHFPCGTTLLTIRQETQSIKWPFISFLVPTVCGMLLCFIVAQGARLLGL
jgi:ferrous iron transport protein B